jgi:hypothetical protein
MEASWANSWMERLLEEGDQGGHHGWARQDFEQDCKESS